MHYCFLAAQYVFLIFIIGRQQLTYTINMASAERNCMKQNAGNTSSQNAERYIFVKVVSQIGLVVRGDDIFRVLRERVLKWAAGQENLRNIPETAWKGDSFEIDQYNSEQAEAIRLDDYWAFRLHLRLKDPSRFWTTEAGIGRRSPTEAAFGVRLICIPRHGNPEPIRRSIPNFVRGIVFTQDTCLDNRKVSADPWLVDSERDVDELVAFLQNPDRHHPVVVFSVPENSCDPARTIIPTTPFIRRTAGFVHTVVITSKGAFALTERLGQEFSVFCQAIRTYNPGFDPDTGLPTDHPLATAVRIEAWNSEAESNFTDFLVEQTLRITRPRHILEQALPSFQRVRSAARKNAYKAAVDEGQETSKLLRLKEEELEAVKKEADNWLNLAEETEKKHEEILFEFRQLKSSYTALQARFNALEKQAGIKSSIPVIPDNLKDIESWAKEHLSGQVELHQRAVKAARNSNFQDVTLVYNALLMMRDLYPPYRSGGIQHKKAFETRLAELGLENTRCFTQKNKAKNFGGEYFISCMGSTRELDWHLKRNNSRNKQQGFRLYYFRDEETGRVIIGYLPGHLKTDFT